MRVWTPRVAFPTWGVRPHYVAVRSVPEYLNSH